MNPASTALVALAMSTDAFAAAMAKGAAMHRPRLADALRAGMIFGLIEALTPIVGWAIGLAASNAASAWDHWIAFGLLAALGLHMVVGSLRHKPLRAEEAQAGRHSLVSLALTGLATSIDAMAVGAGLAFADIPILPVACAIGFATLIMVTLGVMLGRVLVAAIGNRAELLGGMVLIGVGIEILRQHLGGGL